MCLQCLKRNLICVYETREPGETRIASFRRENEALRAAVAKLSPALLEGAPDSPLHMLLARTSHIPAATGSPQIPGEPVQDGNSMSSATPDSSTPSPSRPDEPSGASHAESIEEQDQKNDSIFPEKNLPQSVETAKIATGTGLMDDVQLNQCRSLLDALISSSDEESTLLLASLRLGHPWEAIADHLKCGNGSPKGLPPVHT